MIKKQKGFTIIEIIVVVAIIAILASIILANVTSYNVKSKDAAAKGNLNSLITAAVKYYSVHNSYDLFFETEGENVNPDVAKIASALEKLGYDLENDITLGGNESNWCISLPLRQFSEATYYCVDSKGIKTQSVTAMCANDGSCPQ